MVGASTIQPLAAKPKTISLNIEYLCSRLQNHTQDRFIFSNNSLNSCLILYNPHINYQTLYLICSKYCLVIEFAAALYLLTVCGFVFVLFIILTGLGICKFFCIECKFGHVNELGHNCLWSVETKRRKLYVYSLTPVSLANILL